MRHELARSASDVLRPAPAAPRLGAAALLLAAACSSSPEEPATVDAASGATLGGAPGSTDQRASSTNPSTGANGLIGFVPEGEVPLAETCASRVARETFTSALCSCEDTRVAGYLKTRSFRAGAATEPDELGGSVSVNRDYVTAGYADVGGSFTVAGERDVVFAGYLKSGQDLRFNPAFDVAGLVSVERDAHLASVVRALGRVDIGRDLYMPEGAGFRGIALVDVGGEQHTEAVDVAPPCACGAGELIDVAALVAAAEADNDNASIGLESGELEAVIALGAELTLPSGRFFLRQIGEVGALTLHVTGKAALFVRGDVIATGAFRVELEPDAELDLFVGDNLVAAGAARFGDPARPSATRVYVGGSGDIAIAGASAFVGNLYAPTADVLVGGLGRVTGSLFGKNIIAAGMLEVGYDRAIQEGGESCPPVAEGDVPYLR